MLSHELLFQLRDIYHVRGYGLRRLGRFGRDFWNPELTNKSAKGKRRQFAALQNAQRTV